MRIWIKVLSLICTSKGTDKLTQSSQFKTFHCTRFPPILDPFRNMNITTITDVKKILIDVLNLGEYGEELNANSILLGGLTELDSMAVVSVIAKIEDYFGFAIADDEINGQVFETLGSLSAFVDGKLS